MYDVIGFEAEQERIIANVKSDESNTRNFCVVYRPYNIRFVRFPETMESLLHFLHRLENDYFVYGVVKINFLKKHSERRLYNIFLQAHGFCVQINLPTKIHLYL